MSPYDPEVAHEPFDPDADPQALLEIRPFYRICRQCRHDRRQFMHIIRSRVPIVLEMCRLRYHAEDMRFMERALGHDVHGVRERFEARVIERRPPANNPNNHNNEDQHGNGESQHEEGED